VTLIGADLDESPMAYRRLPDVLRAHAGHGQGRCGHLSSSWPGLAKQIRGKIDQ
jgi:hypothetical protein